MCGSWTFAQLAASLTGRFQSVWRDNLDEISATIRMRPVSRGGEMIDAARHSHKG